MMAKYLATSLAMEKVVSAPRVMRSCLPISTISMSLVGSESRSTMLPASRAATVPVFIATPTSAWARAGRVVGAVAAHGDELALGLFAADQGQLVLGRRLSEEVVHSGLRRDGGRRHGVVARDHDGADAHAAQFAEPLLDAALNDVLEVDDPQQLPVPGDREGRAARLGDLVGDALHFPRTIADSSRLQRQRRSAPGRRDGGSLHVAEDGLDRALADGGARRRRRHSCATAP